MRVRRTAFTIVEVIVAMALLGTSMIAVFGVLRTCATAAQHARMLTRSVCLAERLLVEATLQESPAFETVRGNEGHYTWDVQIAPTPVEDLGAVCVRVKWPEQGRAGIRTVVIRAHEIALAEEGGLKEQLVRRAFTLVEVLVAMLITSFLVLGINGAYRQAHLLWSAVEKERPVYESSRQVIESLRWSLRVRTCRRWIPRPGRSRWSPMRTARWN